jgi:hypothetical protein
VIAFHVSNRYYDLEPAIAAALDDLGFVALVRSSRAGDLTAAPYQYPSRWLVGARNGEHIDAFRALGWQTAEPAEHPFTDDYADLLSYLKLGF